MEKRRKKKIFFFLRVKSKIKFSFCFFLFGYLSYMKYKRWWWGLYQGGWCHPLFYTLQQSQIEWGAMRWDQLNEWVSEWEWGERWCYFSWNFPFSFVLLASQRGKLNNKLSGGGDAGMLCGVVWWWCCGWGWYIGVVGRFLFSAFHFFSFLPLFCRVQFLS